MQTYIDDKGVVRALIHLAVWDGSIACNAGVKINGTLPGETSPIMRSGEREAVTCPLCKKSPHYLSQQSSPSPVKS